jgi:hypothetical protein
VLPFFEPVYSTHNSSELSQELAGHQEALYHSSHVEGPVAKPTSLRGTGRHAVPGDRYYDKGKSCDIGATHCGSTTTRPESSGTKALEMNNGFTDLDGIADELNAIWLRKDAYFVMTPQDDTVHKL